MFFFPPPYEAFLSFQGGFISHLCLLHFWNTYKVSVYLSLIENLSKLFWLWVLLSGVRICLASFCVRESFLLCAANSLLFRMFAWEIRRCLVGFLLYRDSHVQHSWTKLKRSWAESLFLGWTHLITGTRVTNASLLKNRSILCKTSQCLYCKLIHTFQIWVPEMMQYEVFQYFGHLMQRANSLEKKSWCWERLKAGGEGDDRGWDGWMASPTQWTWVWVSSRSWWWTGRPGVLRLMGSQRVGHDWATE